MLLTIEKQPAASGVVVLKITGRISLGRDSQQIEWQVNDLLKDNQNRVVFDLTAVNHMDSTGIGILMMCSARLKKAGGDLRVAGAQGLVGDVLRVTKVDSILGMHETAEEAVKAFGA
ncbi:MAG: STAS domain-containing protein [Terriglobales bacterium]